MKGRNVRIVAVSLALMLVPVTALLAGGAQEEAVEEDGRKSHLTVTTWETTRGLDDQRLIAEMFQERNPDVTVDVVSPPGNYVERILTQTAGGNPPDVFQIGDVDVRRFGGEGRLVDLNSFIEADPDFDVDDFFGGAFEYGNVGGQQLALPKDYSPLVMFYNRGHFDEAGLDYPDETWHWDDLVEATQTIVDQGLSRYGITFGNLLEDRHIEPFIWANNGAFSNDDGTQMTGYLDSPDTIEAMERIASLVFDRELTPDVSAAEALGGPRQLFYDGNTSVLFWGVWHMEAMDEAGIDFGTAVLPKMERHASVLFWAGYSMFDAVEDRDTAWSLLKHYVSTDAQEIMGETRMTPNRHAAERLGQLDDPRMSTAYELADYAEVPFGLKGAAQANAVPDLNEAFERIFLQQADIAETLRDTARAIEAEHLNQ